LKPVIIIAIAFVLLVPTYAYAEGVSLDRSIYPHPTEGHPLTIYVTAPSEVTISAGTNWNNLQVLGTTSSGEFTINYDDLDSFEDVILHAKYYDDVELKEYQKSAMFDDWKSTLQIDQPLYVVNDVVTLTLIDPALNYDSRSVDTFTASEVDINLTYDVGVILLNDPIFSTSIFTETGNHTGIFSATMTIPEKINQYEIHYEETILKPTGGNELPLTITDAIGSFSTVPDEISIDIGDTVTWYSDEEYAVVAGDPDVDAEKLGVLYPHGFNSGIIEEGVFAHEFDVSGMFSHKFDVLGKYSYYDKLNPQMKGVIIVGGLYGTPNDSITNESQDSQIINCSVGTYLVDGVCKPRPDLIETTSVSITSAEPKILNTNNERISTAHVGETLFVGIEIENLGDNTKDFVASYRYLASSVGKWSEWTWVSSSINSGQYSNVAIPWTPTIEDNYEFDIQIWDNVLDKTIITTEKLIVSVKSVSTTTSTTTTEQITPEQTTTEQTTTEQTTTEQTTTPREKVPTWVKNNAKWWSEGNIDDDTFVSGIQFLMKEKIVDIPDLPEQASEKARPNFVDDSKDPQSYVDRYNNEASYKEWFDENYSDYTIEEAVGVPTPIPGWIKNTASWWSEGLISEDEFLKGIEFLVEKRILNISEPTVDTNPIQEKIDVKTSDTVFDFNSSKEKTLNNLIQAGRSNSFLISFDSDKSSDGNQFHTYKVVHDKDGWIGDMSF